METKFGSIQKDPHSPLIRSCSFYMCSTYVRISELPPVPSQKKFHVAYEFSNEKSGSEKTEKN